MKILIIGGHFAPALAFVESLPKDAHVVYVGRKNAFEGDSGTTLEYEEMTKRHIPFYSLQTGRIQRRLTRHTFASLLKLPNGFSQAAKIVQQEKPDVVVGFGGYLSVPVGIVASFFGVPLLIHEQTFSAGLANKLLSRFARKIAISWKSSQKYFPSQKTVLVGNLVPKSSPSENIKKLLSQESKLPLVVITGGSGGSHAINTLLEKILPDVLKKYRVLHQTGDAKEFGDFDRLSQIKMTFPPDVQKRYMLTKFILPEDMRYAFEKAQLVVSRSGVNTVSLLLLEKKQSILIPLQTGQKNEQMENAEYLQKAGLARIFYQKNSSGQLMSEIEELMEKPLKENAFFTSFPIGAAEALLQLVYETVQSNS